MSKEDEPVSLSEAILMSLELEKLPADKILEEYVY